MNIWRSTAGIVEVELTSAAPEETITAIGELGIEILCLRRCGDLSCRFQISRKNYPALRKLTAKRGEELRLICRKGLYWKVKSLLKRPVLLAGLCLWGCMIFFLPSRIFFVRVTGNETIPSRRILEAAESSGIYFGASRRNVRSEKVKNAMIAQIPQLQWVGVNTAGCVATVSVRERLQMESPEETKSVSNIVATKDGFILSATVTRGNPLFQVGQTVKEGQVLVSGYTDCGICIQATRSSAEIYAQTQRTFHAVTLTDYQEVTAAKRTHRKISLLLRKKRINLWKDSGISPTTCGRIDKEYRLTLPGGFRLPVAVCVEIYTDYDVRDAVLSENQAAQKLDAFVQSYLPTQMAAGEIVRADRTVERVDNAYHLLGQYLCSEMIGREQLEQIGEGNGKNN